MTSRRIELPVAQSRAAAHGQPATVWPVVRSPGHAPLMAPSLAATVRRGGAVAAILLIACSVVALIVHVALAAAAREWLAFPFTGIPARPGEALMIFLHNLRALAAVGGLLLIAQSGRWTRLGEQPSRTQHAIRRTGEVLLGGAVLANVIVVGASLGAYGARMLRAALPHGPAELAAYSLALALYAQGRNQRLPARHALVVIAISVALLALAAVLETYVNL